MSYRGRTFCASSEGCARIECVRRLSQVEAIHAARAGVNISYAEFKNGPECIGFIDITEILPEGKQDD